MNMLSNSKIISGSKDRKIEPNK